MVDFSPGPGCMAKAAFMLGAKCILACHNEAHVKVLRGIFSEFLLPDIQKDGSKFAPADKEERLSKCKPERLTQYETRGKRALDDSTGPKSKRAALGQNVDSMLASMEATGPKPKAKQNKPSPAKGNPDAAAPGDGQGGASASGAQASGSGAEAAGAQPGAAPAPSPAKAPGAQAAVAGPEGDLAKMLAQWG